MVFLFLTLGLSLQQGGERGREEHGGVAWCLPSSRCPSTRHCQGDGEAPGLALRSPRKFATLLHCHSNFFFFMRINITLDKRRHCILKIPLTRNEILQQNSSIIRCATERHKIRAVLLLPHRCPSPRRTSALSAWASMEIALIFAPAQRFT